MRFLVLALLIAFLSFSCTGDTEQAPAKSEKVVEEIKPGTSMKDIIRNPVDADQTVDTTNVAKLVFENKRHDFGTVNEGDIVRHEYKFTNEGKVPLIITNAKATCGCTVPKWPTDAIPPGGSGSIEVRFDTKNKPNRQGKPITVTANTYPKETYLQLKGFVTPKE